MKKNVQHWVISSLLFKPRLNSFAGETSTTPKQQLQQDQGGINVGSVTYAKEIGVLVRFLTFSCRTAMRPHLDATSHVAIQQTMAIAGMH